MEIFAFTFMKWNISSHDIKGIIKNVFNIALSDIKSWRFRHVAIQQLVILSSPSGNKIISGQLYHEDVEMFNVGDTRTCNRNNVLRSCYILSINQCTQKMTIVLSCEKLGHIAATLM